jgi:ketosteroid isomerase-like protein
METLVHYGMKVNQMYEAFNRRDLDTILNSTSNDCIWEVMGQPEIPFGGIYHGRDDIKGFFGKLEEALDISDLTVEHILENGNLVIASGHFTAVARKTNKRFSTFFTMTYEFNEDEQLVHFRDCYDTLTCARAMRDA